jgi:F0F1-type ATP synthase gamma subunit
MLIILMQKKLVKWFIEKFEAEEFDVCTIFYNQFKNVITQIPQAQQIIPLNVEIQRKRNLRIVMSLNQMKMKF